MLERASARFLLRDHPPIGSSDNPMHICVYCASSDAVAPRYEEIARILGELLGKRGHTLVYGGGRLGLMGTLARAVQAAGGKVHGVIPQALVAREQAYEEAEELEIVQTMAERQARMFTLGQGFIALPGGFGTLEEITHTLVWKAFTSSTKPLVLVNTGGFYNALLAFFEQFYRERFAHPSWRDLYAVAAHPQEALDLIEKAHL